MSCRLRGRLLSEGAIWRPTWAFLLVASPSCNGLPFHPPPGGRCCLLWRRAEPSSAPDDPAPEHVCTGSADSGGGGGNGTTICKTPSSLIVAATFSFTYPQRKTQVGLVSVCLSRELSFPTSIAA